MSKDQSFDAVIVGGGIAGLSAALWLGRHRRRTLLIDGGRPRAAAVEESHGYLGLDPVSPAELLERGRKTLGRYPSVEMINAEAGSIARVRQGFHTTLGHRAVDSRKVILATGISDVYPDVGNFDQYFGRSVFTCAQCDGYEASGSSSVVFGWESKTAGFAIGLLDWAKEVTVVTNGHHFEGDATSREALQRNHIELIEDNAVRLEGSNGGLTAVVLASGRRIPCSRAFFTIAHKPHNALALSLGCQVDEEGYVAADQQQMTTVPGVYAAGDCTPGMQLLQVAAAQGAIAGVNCAVSLRGLPGVDPELQPGPDPEIELGSADPEAKLSS